MQQREQSHQCRVKPISKACSDLRSAATLLVKVCKVGRERNAKQFYHGCRKLDRTKRLVLPLEVERWECGASGHSGPWGPAGLRRISFPEAVGAEAARSLTSVVSRCFKRNWVHSGNFYHLIDLKKKDKHYTRTVLKPLLMIQQTETRFRINDWKKKSFIFFFLLSVPKAHNSQSAPHVRWSKIQTGQRTDTREREKLITSDRFFHSDFTLLVFV